MQPNVTSAHSSVALSRLGNSWLALATAVLTLTSAVVSAGVFSVTTTNDSGPGSLRDAILTANGSVANNTIDASSVTGTITLASSLPVIKALALTITGPGAGNLTIDGTNAYRVFFVGVSQDAAGGSLYPTTNALFKINGLTIARGRAKGGDGAVNAGGGAGLGGGLFVNAGTVILSNVNFIGNAAVGGRGGNGPGAGFGAGGGGGGLGGPGGDGGSMTNGSWGGGGGGFGYSATGGSNGSGTGTGDFSGGPTGGTGGNGSPGGINGGGGFGPPKASNGAPGNGYGAGGGGAGGGAGQGYFDYNVFPAAWHAAGGFGGFGGGGGGSGGYQLDNNSNGGTGGFGGGGGAGQKRNNGGNGGFGGGAGSGYWPGTPGFGGGSATNKLNDASAGGGGLAAGGAIFVRKGTCLTLIDCNFSGNALTGGAGGVDGSLSGGTGTALGAALFLGADSTNSVSGTNVMTIAETIGGGNDTNAGGGLVKVGTGKLVLGGNNSYVGPTVLAGGTLQVNGSIAASSSLTLGSGTTLSGNGAVADLTANAGSTISPGPGIGDIVAGNTVLNGAGTYNWQLYNATGVAGAGYDVLDINGTLDLTTTTNFTINVSTLSAISPETAGAAINFDNTVSYSWTLARTTDGIIRFNAGKFLVVTTGFANPLGAGRFTLRVVGNDLVLTFSTAPAVVTQPATSVTGSNATLNAAVTPNGILPTTLYFRWGLTTGYGNTTTNLNAGTGTNPVALSTMIGGLLSGTNYHYQAVATNSAGTVVGADVAFTTRVTDTELAALTLSTGPITPAFDPTVTTYSANVAHATTTATVTPTTSDPLATMMVRINGGTFNPIVSGSTSDPLPLNVGANPIDIRVTAQDGVSTKTYTVTVTRAPSTNADLVGLTLSAGTITPAFDTNITNYNATVPNATGSATITPTAADATATIQVSVNGGPFTTIASGVPSGPLILNPGSNLLVVKSTAQDGTTTRTYWLTVLRLSPPVATTQPASAITTSNATLNAAVNPNSLVTTAQFQWGTTTSYGNTTPLTGLGSGNSAVPVNAAISGLLPGTTYHYAVIASNSEGVVTGADAAFTTPALAPVATTLAASGISAGSATLNASVNPNGALTAVYFQWGTNTSYGSATALTTAGNGTSPVAINTALGGLLPGTTYHFIVVASNSVGVVSGADANFTTPPLAPVPTALPATSITTSNATINGSVNPSGAATTAFFQWGLTTGYGNTTAVAGVGSGTSDAAINAALTGLLPGTTYHYAIVASNSVGTATSADATFTTPALAPVATTQPATGVTAGSATLSATVNPNGAPTSVFFQWGTNTTYDSTTALSSAGNGTAGVAINTAVGGLLPGTLYHFAVVASNDVGTVTGADVTFTTPALAPTATALPASAVTSSNATLNATVNPNGAATTAFFQWGLTTSYGNVTTVTAAGSGTSDLALNAGIDGLLPGKTYHYSLAASNSVGAVTSADATFTTPALAPVATTQPATGVTAGSATLSATVNPNGALTTVFFQWGTNTSYGSATAATSAGSGAADVAVNTALGGLLPGTTYHFAVVASNSVGTVTGADASFVTPSLAPVPTVLPASSVTASNATLNGTVNPNGAATTAFFQWGLTTSYGNVTTVTAAGSGTSDTAINATITGLLPGKTYHYGLVASNSVGTASSADATLTTPALMPIATTQPATGITAGSATLSATVNPNGAATSVFFQWGTNTTYGSTTTLTSAGSGTADVAINTTLSGLLPGTTYHFAVVASNSVGVVTGDDVSFTTPALVPSATTQPASSLTASNATLNATVNPNGAATIMYFQWGSTMSYGNTTAPSSLGSGTADLPGSAAIAGLLPGATYHYMVVASNSVGTATGADATFTTPALAPVATTLPASGVTASTATISATVNPNGAVTTVYFRWGTDINYDSSTPLTSAGSGHSDVAINASLVNLLPGTTYHYVVVASNSVSAVTGADATFTTPALAPVATTLSASGLTPSAATLNASVNPNGDATSYYFRWGTTASYGSNTTVTSAGSGTSPVAVNATLGGLLPGTTYHYVIVASNSVGTFTGADLTLRTPALSPDATTLPASGLTPSSAMLNGLVTPNDSATLVYFQWGTNSGYGAVTAPTILGSGFAAVPVNKVLSGLAAGVAYHYRVVASNSVCATFGADRVFGAPGLTMKGASVLTNECHTAFTDPGATATGFVAEFTTTLSAGQAHSLALRPDGTVAAWGDDTFGQTSVPAGLSNAVAVSAGDDHNLAIESDGTVIGWGDDSAGQTTIPAGLGIVNAVAAGAAHSLALQSDGTVVGWGNVVVPVGLSNVVAIAAGGAHSLALLNDGTVVGWGDVSTPVGLSNVVAIAAGAAHSLALLSDGTVMGWGDNSAGQTSVPPDLSNVVAIAAGGAHSLALRRDGTVVGWGAVAVPAGLSNVVAIAAGGAHSLALLGNGTVVAWGNDDQGQATPPIGLVAAAPQTPRLGDLTGSIGVSGSVDANTPGTYPLTYTVTDIYGTTNTVVRTVVVADTTPPQIACPADLIRSVSVGQDSLAVTFPTPTATDACSGVTVVCTPASGTAFPAGANTTVQCTATDASGNAAGCSFSVLVNLPPVVNAGVAQMITLPNMTVNLNGSATDDGLPNALTTAWTKVSGPGTVTFGNAAALSTTATFSGHGVYVLRLTASDGMLSTSNDVVVTINAPPVVNAGSAQIITLPTTSLTLTGTASDDGLPSTLTTTWTKISGPGTVTFDNPAALSTIVSFSASGQYVLRLTGSDGFATVSSDLTITVNAAPVVNAGLPQVIVLPTLSVILTGSVSDDNLPNGTLNSMWSLVSGPAGVTFGNPTSPSTIAAFTVNGTYVLRLTATDGSASAHSDVTITVDARPEITQGPTATGGLMLGDGTLIVIGGQPTTLSIGATDADGTVPGCAWDFGGGDVSTNCNPTYTFTNCQPQLVSVTVGDGMSSTNQTVLVQPACPLTVTKEQIRLYFGKNRFDSFQCRGALDLPTNFIPTGVQVALQAGDVQKIFTLDAKGRAVNGYGTFRLNFNKKKGWSFTVSFQDVLRDDWAAYGLVNTTVKNQTVQLPVFLIFDTEPLHAFVNVDPLHYTATKDKSGQAKK